MTELNFTINKPDETLAAVDKAMEESQEVRFSNGLGASELGEVCKRKLWYKFRNSKKVSHSAGTLRIFEDGHRGEDVMAARLRLLPGIELITADPETGKQFKYEANYNHISGFIDGKIKGVAAAPNTWHIWEHKQTNQKNFNKLLKELEKTPEKEVLKKWNYTYYVQAIVYMHLSGLNRHYLTCATPGGREITSIRTESNNDLAKEILKEAAEITNLDDAPVGAYDWNCNFCAYTEICRGEELMNVNCRTCKNSQVVGTDWKCKLDDSSKSKEEQQAACEKYMIIF